jgi:hypothetical protein
MRQAEVEFLVQLGNELASRRPEVSSFDKFYASGQVQWIAGRDGLTAKKSDVAKKSYLDHLKWYVNLQACLDLRKKYAGSRNRRLPREDAIRENILVQEGLWGMRDNELDLARASAVRESLAVTLGLRRTRKIKELRDAIIIDGYRLGKSHREIAGELDAHEDLCRDPLLEKWRDEALLSSLTWCQALEEPELAAKVKTLFSQTWKRAQNRS